MADTFFVMAAIFAFCLLVGYLAGLEEKWQRERRLKRLRERRRFMDELEPRPVEPMTDPGTEVTAPADAVEQITTTGSRNLDELKTIGQWLAIAKNEPKSPRGLSATNALCMAYVQAMGFPISAASEVHLIQGRFVMSAKLCRALGPSHGVRVVPVEETNDSCTAAVIEISTGNELGRRTFTLAMAARRGLSGPNWANAPERMLWARASKMVLDDFAPWVTVGIMSDEEVGEIQPYDPDEVLTGEVVEDVVPFEDAD